MNMKKITIPIVMGLLCLSFWAKGQENVSFTPIEETVVSPSSNELKVGDRLPAEFWTYQHQFLNGGKVYSKNLSEYKGKWIVLDFWATNCGGCIKEMPKISDIQRKNEDKIQILLVNSFVKMDTLSKLINFFEKNSNEVLGAHLTNIVLDTELKRLFPHKYVGHYIWIDKRGIVRGITSSKFLSSELIESIIKS